MIRLIKKYKNRRLYDTEKSQYLTLDDLQRYIGEGIVFRVEDSVTAKDLTTATLLQIFVEIESGPTQFLSPAILRQLILLANHPLNQYFKQTLEQFFSHLEKTFPQSYLNSEPAANWNEQMEQLLTQWQGFFKI